MKWYLNSSPVGTTLKEVAPTGLDIGMLIGLVSTNREDHATHSHPYFPISLCPYYLFTLLPIYLFNLRATKLDKVTKVIVVFRSFTTIFQRRRITPIHDSRLTIDGLMRHDVINKRAVTEHLKILAYTQRPEVHD